VEDYGTMKSLRLLAFVFCLLPIACERPPTALPTAKASGEGRVKWVDPKTIQPGPIRRDSLTDEQMARIRALQATFVEVDGQTVEQWVDNFKRDIDPDKELRIWERMSKAFRAFCDGRKLSPEASAVESRPFTCDDAKIPNADRIDFAVKQFFDFVERVRRCSQGLAQALQIARL
jgi:hypothetical protein